jgi:hypothetical protein
MYGMGVLDDSEMMKCLIKLSGVSFLSQAPSTVSQNMGKINRALQITHELGLKTPSVPKVGHWKLEDEFGAASAVIMVKDSLDPGVTESTVY